MKIIGYARTSTIDQVNGIDAQVRKIKAWSMIDEDNELVDIVVEHGSGAALSSRPGIQEVFTRLKNGECDALVITKLDRLTRSLRDWQDLIHGILESKTLFCVSDPMDTSTATGRLMLNMILTVAQWEREVISERTKDALRAKKEAGVIWNGSIPFGWMRDPQDQDLLIHDPYKQDILRLCHRLKMKARTWRKIVRIINRWYDNKGKPWTAANLQSKYSKARYYWRIWGDPRGFEEAPPVETRPRRSKDDQFMRRGFRSWEKK